MMEHFNIRTATAADVGIILNFIRKLAIYEKLEDQVCADADTLYDSLFVKRQAEVIIGDWDGVPVAFALFFHNFSTFEGRRGLYLEDLFVEESYRGRGVGKRMLLHLAGLAVERNCARMEWVVLDWNRPAIDFYCSMGAVLLDDWKITRLDKTALLKLKEK